MAPIFLYEKIDNLVMHYKSYLELPYNNNFLFNIILMKTFARMKFKPKLGRSSFWVTGVRKLSIPIEHGSYNKLLTITIASHGFKEKL